MIKQPEFNDYAISEEYAITLPVYNWIMIAAFLQYLNDNTDTTFPITIGQLVEKINDIIFPKAWQSAEEARIAQHREEHVQQHPIVQMFKGLGIPHENPFPFPPNPDDFNNPPPE